MSSPIRAIVLDFNGTLAQDNHLIAPLYVEAFASLGLPLTEEQYHREFAAMPDRDAFALALARAGLPPDPARRDALVTRREEGYMRAVADDPPIDAEAVAFVHAAAARVQLAIASGASRREIEHVLGSAGLRKLFAAVVAIDDVTRGKPDPEGFRRALDGLNARNGTAPPIAPHEAVAVDDATDGARAARAAGMRVVAIRGPGYDDRSGHAELVVDRLDRAALGAILALAGAAEGPETHRQ